MLVLAQRIATASGRAIDVAQLVISAVYSGRKSGAFLSPTKLHSTWGGFLGRRIQHTRADGQAAWSGLGNACVPCTRHILAAGRKMEPGLCRGGWKKEILAGVSKLQGRRGSSPSPAPGLACRLSRPATRLRRLNHRNRRYSAHAP